MRKPIFSVMEARLLTRRQSPALLNLQLHQWERAGELVRLKRGVYGFPESVHDKVEIARALYAPAYVSLEYALHQYGLIPDVPFAVTLVTPKVTRRFTTPFGLFVYRKIRRDLFWGYDPATLMGEPEKVILDYLYLNGARLQPRNDFWEEARWQNLDTVDFRKARAYAKRYDQLKMLRLLKSLEKYGAS